MLKKGIDFTLSYKSNKRADIARVVIKGKGNSVGSKIVKFKIVNPKAKKVRAASMAL